MTTQLKRPDIREFLRGGLPTADDIRARLEQSKAETKLLRRVLRIAVDAEKASGGGTRGIEAQGERNQPPAQAEVGQ